MDDSMYIECESLHQSFTIFLRPNQTSKRTYN